MHVGCQGLQWTTLKKIPSVFSSANFSFLSFYSIQVITTVEVLLATTLVSDQL